MRTMRRKAIGLGLGLVVLALLPAVSGCSRSSGKAPAGKDPIPAAEYQVYAALFGVQGPSGPEAPQFFGDVPKCRLVAGPTLAVEKPLPDSWPGEGFPPRGSDIVRDYLAKNEKAWPLLGPIPVPDLTVLSPEELETRLSAIGLREGVDTGALRLSGGFLRLSRVGFNRAGSLALFSVAQTEPGTMRTQYIVLMKKNAGAWELEKVAMEGLIYQ